MKKYEGTIQNLNARLLAKQNVSDTDTILLHQLHEIKHYVFQLMENTDDSDRLTALPIAEKFDAVKDPPSEKLPGPSSLPTDSKFIFFLP